MIIISRCSNENKKDTGGHLHLMVVDHYKNLNALFNKESLFQKITTGSVTDNNRGHDNFDRNFGNHHSSVVSF